VTGAAYLFLVVGVVVIKGQHDKAERLRRQRNEALRALTKLRGDRLGDSETPCSDELALSRAAHPTHTNTESE